MSQPDPEAAATLGKRPREDSPPANGSSAAPDMPAADVNDSSDDEIGLFPSRLAFPQLMFRAYAQYFVKWRSSDEEW